MQSALEMAEESIVLLKNENDLLPLDFSDYKNILVTGPNANNHTILGDWTLQQPDANVVTILDGIREIAGSAKVNYYNYGDDVRQNSMDKVNEAAAIAKKSDLAIVVVGRIRYVIRKARLVARILIVWDLIYWVHRINWCKRYTKPVCQQSLSWLADVR